MIVKILREFYDKDNITRLFKIGEVVEFADARAKNIIKRGLGECVTKEAEKPVAEEKPAEAEVAPVEEETEVAPVEEKATVEVEETPAEPIKEEVPETPAKRRGRPARS